MTGPRLAVFDLETTGPDPETAEIVTAFAGVMDAAGTMLEGRHWIIGGVEVPEEAAAIHGWSTARLAEHGRLDRYQAIREVHDAVAHLLATGLPLTIYNAPFDLTVLDRDVRRTGGAGLGFTPEPVFDPLVLDKALDRYRKGSRKLVAVAAHHGVPVEEDAHDAAADCLMAGRVMLALLGHEKLAGLSPGEIHRRTRPTYRDQQASLRDYFARQGKDVSGMSPEWPLRAWREAPEDAVRRLLGGRLVTE